MFNARNNTALDEPFGATSIRDFFNFMKSNSLSADDLVIGSHASDEGFLMIALDDSHTDLPINYEDIEAVDSSGSIHIPAGVRGSKTRVHFKGCNIGSDETLPFLRLLKSALDNPKQVTGPKFFHGLYNKPAKAGVFEFMGHDYRVISKDPFKKHDDLVTAFQGAKLTRFDGTPVPNDDIDKLVSRKLDLNPKTSDKKPIAFPVKIVPATGGRKAIDDGPFECRSRRESWPYEPPPGTAANIDAMRAALAAESTMKDTHPYSVPVRLHYKNFDDFFDGQNWKLTSRTKQKWVGTHFVYTLIPPVVKPGTTDELIFNFYPGQFNVAAAPAGAIRSSNVVKIKTTANHTFAVNDMVNIVGVADASFVGTFQIASVPSLTTFTFSQTGQDATSGSGSVTSAPTMNFLEDNATFNIAAAPAGAIRSSNVVTVKTTANHTFAVSDMVNIVDVADASFVGTFQIASVPSLTTFTFSQTGQDATSGSGSVTSARTITAAPAGAIRSSNAVKIETTANHQFAVNDMVYIVDVADASFDGTFQIASVPSLTTFTYSQTGKDATSGSGSVTSAGLFGRV
jgi:hypothetical protein